MMCAVFGIIGKYHDSKAKYALSLLSHRGPDYCGITQNEYLFFAHQRLTIVGSNMSHQPLKYKDILLSFNGEIYNYKELKKELNFKFVTDSDSEVIIAAYIEWGVDFVKHLRGMFAIALKDGDTLYLFRDRLGKKPMFYLNDTSFIFASEIKAIVPFLKKNEMDDDALLSYLSFLAPSPPYTFFKNIKKLSAGEFLTFRDGKYKIKRYYDVLSEKSNIINDKDEAILKLEEVLMESMSIRMDTNIPTASLLSGGIDSATINYYAKQYNLEIPTYTIGYKEFAKYDERINAKKSAESLGVVNRQIEITQDNFIDASEKVFDSLDEPLNDPAAIPLYLLFEKIKKDGYRVVLSGEGSDELFLGYRQYFEYLDIESASNLTHKNWLKRYFHSNFSMNREWEWYKRIFDDTLLFRTSGDKFTDLQKNALMKRNIKDNDSLKYLNKYRERFEKSTYNDETFWYSYIDLNIFQAEHFLTKLDRVSMAHSIESRTPFLDHKLVDTVFSINPKLRYKKGNTKLLLKEIMRGKLDESILSRKKKGFSNPYMEYLINSKKINLIHEVNEKTGIFKRNELNEYIIRATKGSFKQHIWGLYVLSYWIKTNLL